MMSPRPASYVRADELQRLAAELSDRDWAILRFIEQQRYATTKHIQRVLFTEHQTLSAATRATVRVLDRLLTRRLVARLERKIGGHSRGSAAYVWHLDAPGERLLRKKGQARRLYADPSFTFLDHTLAVTETVVVLHEITNTARLRIARVEVEAAAWRRFLGPHGLPVVLKPDLYAQLSSDEYDDHWYLEIDRGTESLPVLLTKSRVYAQYRATHAAQAEHGVFPRVLWIVPTQRRVERLKAAIHADQELPDRIFTCITPEELPATLRGEPSSPEQRKEEP